MKKLLALFLSLILTLCLLSGCDLDITETLTGWAKDISAKLDEEIGTEVSEKQTVRAIPNEDMAGNPITVPTDIRRIVSLEPGVTDMLLRLGLGQKLAGIDTGSAGLSGLPSALNVYDVSALQERLPELLQSSPDILFLTQEAYSVLSLAPNVLESDEDSAEGEEEGEAVMLSPVEQLRAAGVCVACVPEPKTMGEIMKSTLFVGYCFGLYEKSEELVYGIIGAMERIEKIALEVPNVRRVYVELEPNVTVGFGEILNELIGLCGAQNVFLARDNVLRVTDEEVAQANPEIIITCVGDLSLGEGETIHTVGEARMAEISARDGLQDVSAVVSGTLYYLESSLVPGPGIVDAMNEIALMCYPRLYQ